MRNFRNTFHYGSIGKMVDPPDETEPEIECEDCDGTDESCPSCHGTGFYTGEKLEEYLRYARMANEDARALNQLEERNMASYRL